MGQSVNDGHVGQHVGRHVNAGPGALDQGDIEPLEVGLGRVGDRPFCAGRSGNNQDHREYEAHPGPLQPTNGKGADHAVFASGFGSTAMKLSTASTVCLSGLLLQGPFT